MLHLCGQVYACANVYTCRVVCANQLVGRVHSLLAPLGSQILALVIGRGGKNSNTINHLDSPGFGFWSHFFAQTGLYFYY